MVEIGFLKLKENSDTVDMRLYQVKRILKAKISFEELEEFKQRLENYVESIWIDTLLILMVPERKYRFYNQSSGTEKKGDRSEETYVLGNYGDIQEEGKLSATVQQLRPDKKSVFAILLASFQNDKEESVTLFQARWFVDGELKRVFGIAYVPRRHYRFLTRRLASKFLVILSEPIC